MEFEAQINVNLTVLKIQIDALKSTLSEDQLEKYRATIHPQKEKILDQWRGKDLEIFSAFLELFDHALR